MPLQRGATLALCSPSSPQQTRDEQTVLQSLGGPTQKLITIDVLKRRFFILGLQIGGAGQMFFMSIIVMCSSYDKRTDAVYQLTREYYPLFRALFLICFFGTCYGGLLFMFRQHKIDYFALFQVGREHNYHHVIRLSTLFLSMVFTMFVLYVFSLETEINYISPFKHCWPAFAVLGIVVRFLWPGNRTEWHGRAQRYALLRMILMVLMSPFSEVTFGRTFIADILTSMPKIFADIQFTSCLYITGDIFNQLNEKSESCADSNSVYKAIHIGLSCLPFWVRLMQSGRGFVDSRAIKHLANGFKYSMSITVVALSFLSKKDDRTLWRLFSIASSLYAYFWDLCMDWGLGPAWLRRALHGKDLGGSSEVFLLRPKRCYPIQWYYVAMITNAFARFGWAIYISPGQTILRQHFVLLLGCVELLRRTQWSLFRLEWAHICSQPITEPEDPGLYLCRTSQSAEPHGSGP